MKSQEYSLRQDAVAGLCTLKMLNGTLKPLQHVICCQHVPAAFPLLVLTTLRAGRKPCRLGRLQAAHMLCPLGTLALMASGWARFLFASGCSGLASCLAALCRHTCLDAACRGGSSLHALCRLLAAVLVRLALCWPGPLCGDATSLLQLPLTICNDGEISGLPMGMLCSRCCVLLFQCLKLHQQVSATYTSAGEGSRSWVAQHTVACKAGSV